MPDAPSDLLATGLFLMRQARETTLRFLDGLEGDAFVRLFADGGGNAAFIAGHIASTDDFTLHFMAGRDRALTDAQQKVFDGGAEPVADPAAYPPRDEILGLLAAMRGDLEAYFSGLSDAELVSTIEGPMREFAETPAQLMGMVAWHEGMHAGQLTVIRRQLGLARVFG